MSLEIQLMRFRTRFYKLCFSQINFIEQKVQKKFKKIVPTEQKNEKIVNN